MEEKPTPSPELIEWLVNLNIEISTANEDEKKEILEELKEGLNMVWANSSTDPLFFFLSLRFLVLPEILEKAGINIHDDLDSYFLEEIFDATETPDQLYGLCLIMFPMVTKAGISPVASDLMLDKIVNVLSAEIHPRVELGVKISSPEILGALASYLYPYINDAMTQPFAQEDFMVINEDGIEITSGKKYHVLGLIKECLMRLSLPHTTISDLS